MPPETSLAYFDALTAPSKTLRWSETSGHEPFAGEAEAFNRAMVELVRRVAVQAPVEVASSHPVRAVGSLPYTGG